MCRFAAYSRMPAWCAAAQCRLSSLQALAANYDVRIQPHVIPTLHDMCGACMHVLS